MTKPFPLDTLLNLAHQQNDAATRKLGKLNHQQQSAQSRLAALQQYRHEYQVQFEEAEKNGIAPADMRNFQRFIERLDQAIQQQQQEISKATSSVQKGRSELLDSTRKMKSFDTLAQRHVESERKLEAKSEQRLQDEQSGRYAALHATEKNSTKGT
ncbi:flagellar export protein FliJ [Ferrigenium sp. UT5]|uniref:flagellar export protein FliJ n=1 Tax=Ferrigenium sp. UT5 TaxID=3242105 RepID=UPI00354F3CAD